MSKKITTKKVEITQPVENKEVITPKVETTDVEPIKKKRTYKLSEEEKERRREAGKQLSLKKAEKIKQEKEKKKQQVTYKDYVGIINELAGEGESSQEEDVKDDEINLQPPKLQRKPKVMPISKPTKEIVTENVTVITPPPKENEIPKKATYKDIMRQSMMGMKI